jgi:hypothetical protein
LGSTPALADTSNIWRNVGEALVEVDRVLVAGAGDLFASHVEPAGKSASGAEAVGLEQGEEQKFPRLALPLIGDVNAVPIVLTTCALGVVVPAASQLRRFVRLRSR